MIMYYKDIIRFIITHKNIPGNITGILIFYYLLNFVVSMINLSCVPLPIGLSL